MDTKKDEKLTIALKQVKNPDKICSLLLPELSSSRVVRSSCENLLDTGACPLSRLRGGNMSRTSNDVSPVGDHPVDTFVLYSMLRSLHFLFWISLHSHVRSLCPLVQSFTNDWRWARHTTHYSSFPLTQHMVDCLYLVRHPFIMSDSASRLAEFQSAYDITSRELVAVRRELDAVRNELRSNVSSIDGRDCTIASLAAEIEQWKAVGAKKDKQLTTALKEVMSLQQELSTSTFRTGQLERRSDMQSQELISLRNELQRERAKAAALKEMLWDAIAQPKTYSESKDHASASILAEFEQPGKND